MDGMEDFEGGRRRAHGTRRRTGGTLEKRGPSGGGDRGRPPARPRRDAGMADVAPTPVPEAAKPARALLEEILTKMGLDDVEIVYIARSEGEYFEVRGPRLASLIGREGKTLEALNLIYNNIINAGTRSNRKYYTIDAEGYRARRADQLKTLALATLERVVRESRPIKLEPMLPSERKIVHLALADSPFVRTESEGVEPERRLVVFPKEQGT
jgi:spoIIIJ-associated protein